MAISLNQGFQIVNTDPIDSRLVVPDASIRKGGVFYDTNNSFIGLIVYQVDTKEQYVVVDTNNLTNDNGWMKISGSGGGGDPTGSNTEIQFNDNGNFGASSRLTFGKTDGLLRVSGSFEITGSDVSDSFIIKSGSNFNAFKVNDKGVSVLGNFQYTPTAQIGGIMYSSSNLYVGS
tara:strand:+ start:106 stop:630 length:525 start_codon:yes stop_codon:yes gene_type:complete